MLMANSAYGLGEDTSILISGVMCTVYEIIYLMISSWNAFVSETVSEVTLIACLKQVSIDIDLNFVVLTVLFGGDIANA